MRTFLTTVALFMIPSAFALTGCMTSSDDDAVGDAAQADQVEGAALNAKCNPHYAPIPRKYDGYGPITSGCHPTPVPAPINPPADIPGAVTEAPDYPGVTYKGPVVDGPTYNGPTYQKPGSVPVIEAPDHQAPLYGAPTFEGPHIKGPIYEGPTYLATTYGPATYEGPMYLTPPENPCGGPVGTYPPPAPYKPLPYTPPCEH